jgi:hypothetical protein
VYTTAVTVQGRQHRSAVKRIASAWPRDTAPLPVSRLPPRARRAKPFTPLRPASGPSRSNVAPSDDRPEKHGPVRGLASGTRQEPAPTGPVLAQFPSQFGQWDLCWSARPLQPRCHRPVAATYRQSGVPVFGVLRGIPRAVPACSTWWRPQIRSQHHQADGPPTACRQAMPSHVEPHPDDTARPPTRSVQPISVRRSCHV